ncbi:MAG: phage terminase large subunit family protein, partial [Candidatus Zixiibacteriota bacterium]
DDVQAITCGADYHEDDQGNVRIDYILLGWAHSIRLYNLAVGRVPSWEHFTNEVFRTPFPWASGDLEKPELIMSLAGIDSGFMSHIIYEFCDKWPGRAIPLKGGTSGQAQSIKRSAINPESVRRKSRKIVKPGTLYTFDPLIFKDIVYSQITAELLDGPGSIQFFAECPYWYTEQLCNEKRVKTKDKKGRVSYTWVEVSEHAECHGLDITVAAIVAGYLKGFQYLKPPEETKKQTKGRRIGKNQRFNN